MAIRSERVISPLPRKQFATEIGYYGIFSGYFEDSCLTSKSVSLQSLLGGFAEFFASWRFYLGVLCSVPVAIWLHERFGDETWVWFVSVPLVLLGTVGGLIWQLKKDK